MRLCACRIIHAYVCVCVQQFMDKVDELSSQALRVLAIACVHLGLDLPHTHSLSLSLSLSLPLSLSLLRPDSPTGRPSALQAEE